MKGSITLSAMRNSILTLGAALVLCTISMSDPAAQGPATFDAGLFSELPWRNIGPHRASRTKALDGVPSQPHTFYIGVANGGVWKTTDAGRTWLPIFDQQPTGSIGALAVSLSDPNVIYVGAGEAAQRPDLGVGNGMYKSIDAGKTWTHRCLRDSQQIGQVAIDPNDSNRLFVAALGHPYGPNTERGIFRSTDGGTTFERVLYKDENTGATDIVIDPSNPSIIYAALWQARQGPWENGDFRGPNSGLFKSIDGGATWKQLGGGFPTWEADRLGRIGIGIAPSRPSRLFAVVEARNPGLFRSDDAGETWTRVNSDPRVIARPSDATDVRVHPTNLDIVIVPTIVTWKSTDGGRTFTAIRGAPGGDDYQRAWFNPTNPDIIAMTSDQGAVISLNNGQTWSSWYNQATAAFYHVTTDNSFPYRVCSGQQESGSVCIQSRGDEGQITFREWSTVGVEEYGYVAPDPLDPDIVYGGKVSRWDRRTRQVQQVGPRFGRPADYRVVRTMPVLFSPVNPRKLYFSSNMLWQTIDGGREWDQISPDLTRKTWEIPKNVGIYSSLPEAQPTQRGVIYTIAPSYLDERTIWVGTDDGLIHVTSDGGKSWNDVTPPSLTPWSKVSIMDASHFDAGTAYAAVNTFRLDDLRPHIYRTRDGGKTWTHITAGIPDGGIINVVREDPKRRGLLFAGSEQAVYVSFDDGEHWQSLRLNMPATSIRDLVVKDEDLVIGTHGRSFWILDDIESLRQISQKKIQNTVLFKPASAYRVRWNMNTDTPLPQEEPSGQNPPDGAMIDYYLSENANNVLLEVMDAKGNKVAGFSNKDTLYKISQVNIPLYWIRKQQIVSTQKGAHRFVWDLHYQPLNVPPSYPIAAVYQNTAPNPTSPWVMPGNYIVKLTVDGKTFVHQLTIQMDPRVKTSVKDLQTQHDLSLQAYNNRKQILQIIDEISILKTKTKDQPIIDTLIKLQNGARGSQLASFDQLSATFASLHDLLQDSDMPPTMQMMASMKDANINFQRLLQKWNEMKRKLNY